MKKFIMVFLLIPAYIMGAQSNYIIRIKNSESSELSSKLSSSDSEIKCMDGLCFVSAGKDELEYLESNGLVEYWEEDIIYYPLNTFGASWSYSPAIFPPYEEGRTNLTKYVTPATGFIAAVIDTGFSKHSNIYGTTDNQFGFLAQAAPGQYCVNLVTNLDNCIDFDGHGTHVAGIIASREGTTNFGTGYGQIQVLPYVTEMMGMGGSMSGWSIITALEDIYQRKSSGANIVAVNMSLGSLSPSTAQYEALDALRRADVIVVAAAGNSYNDIPHFPASYDLGNMVSVLALDPPSTPGGLLPPADYTTYGKGVTIGAPGTDILSGAPVFDTAVPGNIIYDASSDPAVIPIGWTLSGGVYNIAITGDQPNDIEGDVIIAGMTQPLRSFYVYYEGNPSNSCNLIFSYQQVLSDDTVLNDKAYGDCKYDANYINIPVYPGSKIISYSLAVYKNTGTSTIDNVKIKLTAGDLSQRSNAVKYSSGTSMAAPFVTGAVVSGKSVFPEATAGQLMYLLYMSSAKNPALDGKVVGNRQIDVGNFIKASALCGLMGDMCLVPKKYPPKESDIQFDNQGKDFDPRDIPVLNRIDSINNNKNGSGGCSASNGSFGADLSFITGVAVLLYVRFRHREGRNDE